MKIAVLDPGAFTIPYDHALCDALAGLGHEVHLVSRGPREEEGPASGAYAAGPAFYRVSEAMRLRSGLRALYRFAKGIEHLFDMGRLDAWLRKYAPDIIHVQWTPLPILDRWFLARWQKRYPLVLTVHDTHFLHGSAASRLQFLGLERVMQSFDHYFVHTAFSRQELIAQGISAQRVSVVPHGLLGFCEEEAAVDGEVFSHKTILFFGTLKDYKGVDVLLRAFAAVPEAQRADWRVHIAGAGGRLVDELKALAARLGIDAAVTWDVRYLPEREIPGLARAAEIVVFPYREIDASGAFKALLPYGRAMVVSRVGVFAETLADGESALLVKPGDFEDLAKALARVMCNGELRSRLGRGARAVSERIPAWSDIARQTVEIYESVVTQRARG